MRKMYKWDILNKIDLLTHLLKTETDEEEIKELEEEIEQLKKWHTKDTLNSVFFFYIPFSWLPTYFTNNPYKRPRIHSERFKTLILTTIHNYMIPLIAAIPAT